MTPEQRIVFQSQTRCQAPGDVIGVDVVRERAHDFNLRRDARPLATLLPTYT